MTSVYLLLHDLDADDSPDGALDELLADDERIRAQRFVHALHRRRYRVGRATLRRTLATWTGHAAASIAFEYGRNGKPVVRNGPAFNVSHSEGSLLIGVAERGCLGVDIEVLRPIRDREALATANFAPDEAQAIERLPPSEQEEAFFRIWTCKEALIKAVGDGLSIPLDSFCVSPTRTHNALVARSAAFPSDGRKDWCIRPVSIESAPISAAAAVAIDVGDCDVSWVHAPR